MLRRFAIAALLACLKLAAQDSETVILAAGRSGLVEFINAATLETVGRIHLPLTTPGAGLNSISASADGALLYFEGPVPSEPQLCCALYSIDLATLQVKLAASIPGSSSRRAFVASDSAVYAASKLTPRGIPRDMTGDRLHLSPDGRWLFGVRSFRGPALDMYDVGGGRVIRQLQPPGLEGNWWPAGAWSGSHFYLYAANDQGTGRLWNVAPEASGLGPGVSIAPPGWVPGCATPSLRTIVAVAGSLFLYEEFGFKLDRRNQCAGAVPGGAWLIDAATGQLTRQIAPDLHFSTLLPDEGGGVLYGLSAEAPNSSLPIQLVRIDPGDGRILQSRTLDPGYWRIALATLRVIPSGDVHATPGDF